VIDLALRYQTRAGAYFLLLTETWPPFAEPSHPRPPAPTLPGGFAPPIPPR
jgi:hypothetical protein